MAKTQGKLKLILVWLWLAMTLALVGWWLYFGLVHLDYGVPTEYARQQRMLIWEGAIFMLLLVAGGAAMVYFISLERRRSRQVREFFAAFSHDLKTSLASLRLQAESLAEDLATTEHSNSRLLQRLVNDTTRLQLQLENSLFLADEDDLKLVIEKIDLRSLLEPMAQRWPDLKFEIKGNCRVRGDSRALESIINNLVQNSIVHGQADKLEIEVEPLSNERVQIRFSDNGKGFQGDKQNLGQLFGRSYRGSGSGVGLYISKLLLAKMQGKLMIPDDLSSGFVVDIQICGEAA